MSPAIHGTESDNAEAARYDGLDVVSPTVLIYGLLLLCVVGTTFYGHEEPPHSTCYLALLTVTEMIPLMAELTNPIAIAWTHVR